ncbi:MAG: DUF2807 domain-containing protein [Acidobacteria bacterium]|nr:DUF2807 domain-containing protein [Acidobacteriota bacterium]
MKKIGILLFLAALVIGVAITGAFSFGPGPKDLFSIGSLFRGEVGSGHLKTEKRDVADFDRIEVSGVVEVEVTRGDTFSVEVSADDNLLPLLRTEVDGDTLSIYTKGRISKSTELKVVVTAPNISEAETSGVSKLSLMDVKNEHLSLQASGASRVTVSGTTASLTIDISGASKALTSELLAKEASIETSGASNADVNVSEMLKAQASGASHIRYLGSPLTVKVDRSGAASVSRQTAN